MGVIGKLESLNRLSRPAWLVLGLISVGVIGYVDIITGYEVGFSLFYMIPVALVTWFGGSPLGITIAMSSGVMWGVADALAGAKYSSHWILIWNTFIRLTFFLITVFSVKEAKELDREKNFSRIDYTTGAMNSRFFRILAEREMDRSVRSRHPFTTAYIDLDNFKTINDLFGHAIGDEVLRTVATSMQQNLRRTDLVARMGGDEFVVLLPEVGLETAAGVISKLHGKLTGEMEKHGWPTTFSIGVVTFTEIPRSMDEMLSVADDAMYSVKHGSKNSIRYAEFSPAVAGEPLSLSAHPRCDHLQDRREYRVFTNSFPRHS